jgi:hypothetical protein
LPWPSKLEAPGAVIRAKTTGIKLIVTCRNEKKEATNEIKFVSNGGSKCCEGQSPIVKHGTSALHPGFLEFDVGSGELEEEGSAEAGTVKTEGELRTHGYEEQELINVK